MLAKCNMQLNVTPIYISSPEEMLLLIGQDSGQLVYYISC